MYYPLVLGGSNICEISFDNRQLVVITYELVYVVKAARRSLSYGGAPVILAPAQERPIRDRTTLQQACMNPKLKVSPEYI